MGKSHGRSTSAISKQILSPLQAVPTSIRFWFLLLDFQQGKKTTTTTANSSTRPFFFLLFLPSPVGNLLKNCLKTSNRLLPAGQQFVLSEKMSIERDRNTANHAHIISLMNDTPRVETDIFPSFIPRSNLVKLLFSLVRSVTVVKTTGPKLPDNWRWCPTRAVCVPVCGTSPPLSSLFHGSAYVLAHIAGPAAPPAPLSLLRFLAETTYFYK